MTFEEKDNLLNTYYAEVLKLKTFLSSTDYQTIRESEGGAPMSDETRKERANARARVNELEELIAKTKEIEPEVPERPDDDMIDDDDMINDDDMMQVEE